MSGNVYQDPVTVTISGMRYGGWTVIDIKRSIEHMCSSFDMTASNPWTLGQQPWSIQPYEACQIWAAGDLLLTGYVDEVMPEISGRRSGIRILGRSKTEDLVDCCPDVPSGQYSGYNLGQIAAAVCAPFGIDVIIQTDVSNTFADATIQRGETAYKFLERLCRLSGVLACDDENGNLVLTNTGTTRASTPLQQGVNIWSGHALLTGAHRFSTYIVKSQTSVINWSGAGGVGTPSANAQVDTQIRAVANDPAVPRYRPHVAIAESQLDQAGAQERATWMARYEAGKGTQLLAVVKGFRQASGAPWEINQMTSVTAPFCGLNQDLLIAHANFKLDDKHGHRTELRLAPPDAYAPDPGEVKLHKSANGGINWNGAGGITTPGGTSPAALPPGVAQT